MITGFDMRTQIQRTKRTLVACNVRGSTSSLPMLPTLVPSPAFEFPSSLRFLAACLKRLMAATRSGWCCRSRTREYRE